MDSFSDLINRTGLEGLEAAPLSKKVLFIQKIANACHGFDEKNCSTLYDMTVKPIMEEFTEEEILRIESIMYLGRDDEDLGEIYKHLRGMRQDKHRRIDDMLSKVPFPKYLFHGLTIAEVRHENIDADTWA